MTRRRSLATRTARSRSQLASVNREHLAEVKRLETLRQSDGTAMRSLTDRVRRAETRARRSEARVKAMGATMSWRVTRPLRGVKRFARRSLFAKASTPRSTVTNGEQPGNIAAVGASEIPTCDRDNTSLAPNVLPSSQLAPAPQGEIDRLDRRVNAIRTILGDGAPSANAGLALAEFEAALDASALGSGTKAWLGFVAATGAYPKSAEHDEAAPRLSTGGSKGLHQAHGGFVHRPGFGSPTPAGG